MCNPVPVELLEALAAEAQPEAQPAPSKASSAKSSTSDYGFNLDDWMKEYCPEAKGPQDWHGGRIWVFQTCPFDSDHANGSAHVSQRISGVIGFECKHNGCAGKRWRDLRELKQPGCYDRKEKKSATGHAAEPEPTITPIDLVELWNQYPSQNEPIIDGLLRRGQVGNLVSTSKAYKTYLVLGLAITTAKGGQWLDRFPCAQGRSLIIDMELQHPDIVRRTKEIAAAMHCGPDDLRGTVEVVPLRGKMGNINALEKLLLSKRPREFSLVIIDPLYKCYPDPFDENSNAQMTLLYQRFERLAEYLQCALLIVHHGTKGNQSEKRVVDVGSGASAQSRSADCHIAIREHDVEGAVVFDARVRSFPPADPLVLRWEYPLWRRALDLDPEQLAQGGKRRKKEEPAAAPDPAKWTAERFAAEVVGAKATAKQVILAKAKAIHDIPSGTATGLLALAEAEKLIHRWSFGGDNKVYFATAEQPLTATAKGEK